MPLGPPARRPGDARPPCSSSEDIRCTQNSMHTPLTNPRQASRGERGRDLFSDRHPGELALATPGRLDTCLRAAQHLVAVAMALPIRSRLLYPRGIPWPLGRAGRGQLRCMGILTPLGQDSHLAPVCVWHDWTLPQQDRGFAAADQALLGSIRATLASGWPAPFSSRPSAGSLHPQLCVNGLWRSRSKRRKGQCLLVRYLVSINRILTPNTDPAECRVFSPKET